MSDKEEAVFSWRKECLIKAGWEPSIALELAQSKVDLRVAEAAIACGDPEKALYLLSVTDGT